MPSILDEMTKGIMQTKADKASKLTPVAGETQTSVAQVAAALPKDLPGMYMADVELMAAVKTLRQAADAVEALLGQRAAEAAAPKPRKEDERFAGKDPVESFEDRMTRISAEAQAATFASADAGADEEPAAPAGEWTCPKHGASAVIELKAKGGRVIRACDLCDQVEP